MRNRIVLLARIAAGEIGAPGAVNQQAIAGENPVLGIEAYRVGGMAGRVQHLELEIADDQPLAVLKMHRDMRGRGSPMHRDRRFG